MQHLMKVDDEPDITLTLESGLEIVRFTIMQYLSLFTYIYTSILQRINEKKKETRGYFRFLSTDQ
jgi:hypothetical protein